MGDDHLVSKAQHGDPAALDTLFRREWKPVYALIYRSVWNRAEAEDLTQDAFLRTLKAFGRYQDTGVPFRQDQAIEAALAEAKKDPQIVEATAGKVELATASIDGVDRLIWSIQSDGVPPVQISDNPK